MSQSLRKSGQFLCLVLLSVTPERLSRNPFVNQVSFFGHDSLKRRRAQCRNPFVNQVSFFYLYRVFKGEDIALCRNPFVNQVSFFPTLSQHSNVVMVVAIPS